MKRVALTLMLAVGCGPADTLPHRTEGPTFFEVDLRRFDGASLIDARVWARIGDAPLEARPDAQGSLRVQTQTSGQLTLLVVDRDGFSARGSWVVQPEGTNQLGTLWLLPPEANPWLLSERGLGFEERVSQIDGGVMPRVGRGAQSLIVNTERRRVGQTWVAETWRFEPKTGATSLLLDRSAMPLTDGCWLIATDSTSRRDVLAGAWCDADTAQWAEVDDASDARTLWVMRLDRESGALTEFGPMSVARPRAVMMRSPDAVALSPTTVWHLDTGQLETVTPAAQPAADVSPDGHWALTVRTTWNPAAATTTLNSVSRLEVATGRSTELAMPAALVPLVDNSGRFDPANEASFSLTVDNDGTVLLAARKRNRAALASLTDGMSWEVDLPGGSTSRLFPKPARLGGRAVLELSDSRGAYQVQARFEVWAPIPQSRALRPLTIFDEPTGSTKFVVGDSLYFVKADPVSGVFQLFRVSSEPW